MPQRCLWDLHRLNCQGLHRQSVLLQYLKSESSVTGAVQGLFPEAVSVKVTVPFRTSDAPGIYVVVKELEDVNVPSPDRVQAYVLGTPSVTDTWPGENV